MIRVNAIFEEKFLKRLTEVSREQHRSRSELIRDAVQDYLDRYRAKKEADRLQAHRHEAAVVQDALRAKSGSWDGSKALRHWRDNR